MDDDDKEEKNEELTFHGEWKVDYVAIEYDGEKDDLHRRDYPMFRFDFDVDCCSVVNIFKSRWVTHTVAMIKLSSSDRLVNILRFLFTYLSY